MRILHLLHQYLPEKTGGTELYTQTLWRHQRAMGHDAALFTPSQQAHPPETAVFRVPLGQRSPTAVLGSNFYQPAAEAAFTQALQIHQPQLVHIQHLMGLPFKLVKQIEQAGIPYVVTLHDYWYWCANAQLFTNYDETVCAGPRGWLNCARCALARAGFPHAYPLMPAIAPLFAYRHGRLAAILNGAAALIAPTQFTADIYRQMGVQPQVIPHGIQLPAQLPARPRPSGLHIAYIGGIAPQKGVHVLIDALNRLPTTDMRATIYGDLHAFPDYVAELQTAVRHPGVRFAGLLPHAQLWHALAEVDLVVVPTLWYETASLIVQEAFAAGVPVLASDIGVMPERVRDGVNGQLFAAGDAAALAALLQKVWAEPALLAQWRAGIEPVFTIEAHVAAVTAVYEQALAAQPSPPPLNG